MGYLMRAQIYIQREQMQKLKLEAKRERKPVSVLIRSAISRFLNSKDKNINWDTDPLTRAVGKIKLSVRDASVNHNKYLYGRIK